MLRMLQQFYNYKMEREGGGPKIIRSLLHVIFRIPSGPFNSGYFFCLCGWAGIKQRFQPHKICAAEKRRMAALEKYLAFTQNSSL